MKILDYDDNGCWWRIIEIIKQRNLDFSINAIFFYTVRLLAFLLYSNLYITLYYSSLKTALHVLFKKRKMLSKTLESIKIFYSFCLWLWLCFYTWQTSCKVQANFFDPDSISFAWLAWRKFVSNSTVQDINAQSLEIRLSGRSVLVNGSREPILASMFSPRDVTNESIGKKDFIFERSLQIWTLQNGTSRMHKLFEE